jgi:hypothetical protein
VTAADVAALNLHVTEDVLPMRANSRLIVVLIVLTFCAFAAADVFDTSSLIPANSLNYWPWGDSDITRFQMWFSQSALTGHTGTLLGITQFITEDSAANLGTASYDLQIFASTTLVDSSGLSANDPDSNRGANNTLIFSGNFPLLNSSTLHIDTLPTFDYDGSGNLLLDFVFSSYNDFVNYGPIFESMGDLDEINPYFFRVTNHNRGGNKIYGWGAPRTQLDFGPSDQVPEPSTMGLLLMGLTGLLGLRRRRA